jgi:hypothetical protein
LLETPHNRSAFLYGARIARTLFDDLDARAGDERIEVKNATGSGAMWLAGVRTF